MTATLNIGIIGCGTAGPAAATLLARSGHRVTILERATHLGPVGAGLLIQPTGQAVLSKLGLLERAITLGHRIDRLDGRTATGRRVIDMKYADLDARLFGIGIHRGALFTLLLDAATRCPNVEIRTGVCAERLCRDAHSVSVVDDQSRTHGAFDLLVIADGARSAVASSIDVRRTTRRYSFAAMWFVAECNDPHLGSTLWQVYRGTRAMIGMLPSGRAAPDGPETVSVFWSLPFASFGALKARGLEAWKREARTLDPRISPLLECVRSFDDIVLASYADTRTRPVHDGRVVMIGDAAHAMSPQLGQGANLALVDAADLAHCLNLHAVDPQSLSLTQALKMHDRRRKDHVRFYSLASRWLTPWFQSSLEPLAWPRDWLFEPISRIGWIRREMVRSLAGIKDGIFSHRDLDHFLYTNPEVAGRGRKVAKWHSGKVAEWQSDKRA